MSPKNNEPHDGFDFVKSSGGIEEYTLKKNNLTILVLEDRSAPVATFMVTYHVGSRNEAIGHTGATHLLEHLMFKGSRNFNKEKGTAIWTELQNLGAQINATTWNDRTNYFEVVPSEHLERAIAIESDRMRYAFLRDEDRQPEMTVVRNEYERGENSPFDVLDKNIWATAYQAHPYHHSTIGWRSDIENVSTERLQEFYHTYYWPNNATATVIGDFDKKEALSLIKKYFGEHTACENKIPEMYTEEPAQEGPRRTTVKRIGQTSIVGVAHKTPKGLHRDTYSFQLLGKILADGKTSRFHKKIIDQGLATSIFMYDFPFKDNGLFITYAFLTPGVEHHRVEEIILNEYEDTIKNGVSSSELNRAKAQMRASVAYSRDGSYAVASALNEAIAIGDWTFYTTFMDNIESVSGSDIQEAAKTYLKENQSTVGYFIALDPK
jgi:zinc protease